MLSFEIALKTEKSLLKSAEKRPITRIQSVFRGRLRDIGKLEQKVQKMAGSTRTKATGTGTILSAAETHAAHWGVREVMDIRQAAEYLGISPDSLYKYSSENFIPAFKLGNRWRFKRSLLENWMERQSSLHQSHAREKNIKPKQKKPVGKVR